MSKKYLSIEEAAAQIGISTAELNRLREKGAIRAFADRGTWKFKEEEVEKLVRSRQTDSDPEVPLGAFGSPASEPDSDLLFSDDDISGSEPTIIRKGRDDGGSDSDVRLIFDDSMNVPEAPAGQTPDDSDSDVKLAGGTPAAAEAGSDSDVKLVTDTDSADLAGSDSDVQLVSSDSSGDVKIPPMGSSVISGKEAGKQPGSGKGGSSGIDLVPAAEGSSIIEEDSGISLVEGSGISLASDSGISLERPNDSGISLSEESAAVLSDSGISLADEDSGISLAPEAPKVKGGKGKGKGAKAAADSDDLTGTIPLMDIPLADEDEVLDTQMEVPMLGDSSDEADVIGGSSDDATSVITLDDDDGPSEYSVTSIKKKRPSDGTDEQDVYTGEEAIVEDADEAVDVADEIIGEDDELGEDVFGAEDEDFGDVESGESSADLPIGGPRVAAPVEQDWGAGTFAGLALSAILMLACGTVMFDMVRNMWHVDSPARMNPVASSLLEVFKGI